jgi:hypothetical protein
LTSDQVSYFFQKHLFFDFLFGDPLKTGKLSLEVFIFAGLILYVLGFFLLRLYNRFFKKKIKISSESEWVYELLSEPVRGSMKVSAILLKDAIRAHYTVGFREFTRRYWLNVVGACVVSVVVYSTAVFLVLGTEGISLDKVLELINGDWNHKFGLISGFVANNVYLNGVLIGLYITSVIGYAKITFLEGQYWNQRRLGVTTTFPLAEWDETPKLNVPDAELVNDANNAIHELLSKRKVDFVRVKLASGFDTIGPTGYLNDLLRRPNITWQILLLNPDSDGAARRAKGYLSGRASDPPKFSSPDDYVKAIRQVLDHLSDLRKNHNPRIQVKLYDHTPQWRVFLFSGIGVISGFGPGQRSDRAPLTVFEKTSTSLYYPFEEMFEDIWQNASKSL